MMHVIDRAYIGGILDLPDGAERLERWIRALIEERDTAERIAKACIKEVEPLRQRRDELLAVLAHETQVRRDQRIELQAEIDAAYGELDWIRPAWAKLESHLREQCEHLQCRIKDGDELGATVWRLALEDVVRENRLLLGETADG